MDVDLYCKHCTHVIDIICTNLSEYEHSVHTSGYESVLCGKCKSVEHVVIRCYIPRKETAQQMDAREKITDYVRSIGVIA